MKSETYYLDKKKTKKPGENAKNVKANRVHEIHEILTKKETRNKRNLQQEKSLRYKVYILYRNKLTQHTHM